MRPFIFPIALLLLAGWPLSLVQARTTNGLVSQSPMDQSAKDAPRKPGAIVPRKPAPTIMNFRCDGRQYCSQMTSRAEAEYFLQHCPDTRMDGDYDGIPCENDSRF